MLVYYIDMKFLYILQIIVAILLIIAIVLQQKGGGLSSVFGGGSSVFQVKRGAEKFMHIFTIVLAVLFCVISAAHLFIK